MFSDRCNTAQIGNCFPDPLDPTRSITVRSTSCVRIVIFRQIFLLFIVEHMQRSPETRYVLWRSNSHYTALRLLTMNTHLFCFKPPIGGLLFLDCCVCTEMATRIGRSTQSNVKHTAIVTPTETAKYYTEVYDHSRVTAVRLPFAYSRSCSIVACTL